MSLWTIFYMLPFPLTTSYSQYKKFQGMARIFVLREYQRSAVLRPWGYQSFSCGQPHRCKCKDKILPKFIFSCTHVQKLISLDPTGLVDCWKTASTR